jgi:hypothetical protein
VQRSSVDFKGSMAESVETNNKTWINLRGREPKILYVGFSNPKPHTKKSKKKHPY